MDFDLFDSDNDDDLIESSMTIEHATQLAPTGCLQNYVLEFQCLGEDSLKSHFSPDGFIGNSFVSQMIGPSTQMNPSVEAITLTSYEFDVSQMYDRPVSQFVFGEACTYMQYLKASIREPIACFADDLSYYQRRRHVTKLLHLVLHAFDADAWPLLPQQLRNLRTLLNRLVDRDTWKLLYFANSNKGNDCNVPAYHLLHGALEWKFIDLCILNKFSKYERDSLDSTMVEESAEFPKQLSRIFDDLIVCSLCLFAKKHTTDLLFSSPFPCTCIKEMWLLLQLSIERVFEMPKPATSFWSIFNVAMARVKEQMEHYALSALAYAEFSNWLLCGLTRLYGYRSNGEFEGFASSRLSNDADNENYAFAESCTQQFLNANPNEEQLRIFIGLQTPLLLHWWRPKANVPMALWEYYQKRLNSSFYVAGSMPGNLAVACASGRSYVDKYRQLLQREQPDANLSSYTLFTLLLGNTLRRLQQMPLNNHAQKLLGRIYTKFSLQKFLALNETGIHHLIELFLVLLLSGDFADLAPKLRDKLLSISLEKVAPNKQVAVTKGHMALLILCAEHNCDLSEYVGKLLQQLSQIRGDFHVSKVIADALLDIFEHADDFKRGEHLLIDTWLPSFLNACTPSEQDRTLQALHMIFGKLQTAESAFADTNANGVLIKSLNTYVLPYIKQQYMSSYSVWLPRLAADFCLHAAAGDFQKLFAFFAEAQAANRQAALQFLLNVMASLRSGQSVDDSIVLQLWLKSLVLLTAVNEEVQNLTTLVVHMQAFKFISALEDTAVVEVLKAKEPLCVFVAAVGKNYEASGHDYNRRCRIADNFNDYLRNFDKWLQGNTQLEKPEVLFRFYSFIAIVIYNCPHIVYAKSRISCFFHVAMTRFVLPTNIQMGKPPEGKLAQLVHKVWPVLVQGIGRLNFKGDAYVNKTLTDLIQKWTPHFKISANAKVVARPYITCLQGNNHELSLFIFEKLTAMFLATQRRQADPHACMVVTVYQEVVDSIASVSTGSSTDCLALEQQLETFMKGACLLTLEHIMMVDEVVPSRGLLLDLFKRLTHCSVYRNSRKLQGLLAEHLRILTKKHLAYYTFYYFELLTKLTQICHSVVDDIMDFLLDEVRIVEEKRGGGPDNRIRTSLKNLKDCIDKAKGL